MTASAKKAKITREVAPTLALLRDGADPESLGQSAYVKGWQNAYTHGPDAPAKSGWIARFERGQADRVAFDTLNA